MKKRVRTEHEAIPESSEGHGGLASGADGSQSYLQTLPSVPGVYRMLNAEGIPLYVGKAKSLRKRVAAYTRPGRLPPRLHRRVRARRLRAGAALVLVQTN